MSSDMVYEDVPRLSRRSGDMCIAGANNAAILLGRDRRDRIDSGYGTVTGEKQGKKSGSVHVVVGRSTEDPSIVDDMATIYLSSMTDPDYGIGTESIGPVRKGTSGIVMRADCVRISSRADFRLSVGKAYLTMESSGKIVIEGDVSLGADAAERMIRGDAFSTFWNTVTVPTPMGPSGPPPPIPGSVFSQRNKVK